MNARTLLHDMVQSIGGETALVATMAAKRAAYTALLQAHDWTFEWSDDHSRWKAGRAEFERIKELQPLVDRDGALWRQYAPADVPAPTASVPCSLLPSF